MRSLCVSAMRNSSVPLLWPALISAPTSVLRAVMTPVERSNHPLERLQVAQPRHVGRGRLGGCGLRGRIAGLLVRVLFGYGLGRQQSLPPRVGALGEILVCARGRQIGLCLGQLLVDFRGLDLREQLSLGDGRADVGIPGFQVAAGARVDRRLNEGLYGPGQDQLFAGRAGFGGGGGHGRYGRAGVLLQQLRAGEHPADLAPNTERNGDSQGDPRESADFLIRHGQPPRARSAAASFARESSKIPSARKTTWRRWQKSDRR